MIFTLPWTNLANGPVACRLAGGIRAVWGRPIIPNSTDMRPHHDLPQAMVFARAHQSDKLGSHVRTIVLAEGKTRNVSAASLFFQTHAMLYQARLRPHILPHTVLNEVADVPRRSALATQRRFSPHGRCDLNIVLKA